MASRGVLQSTLFWRMAFFLVCLAGNVLSRGCSGQPHGFSNLCPTSARLLPYLHVSKFAARNVSGRGLCPSEWLSFSSAWLATSCQGDAVTSRAVFLYVQHGRDEPLHVMPEDMVAQASAQHRWSDGEQIYVFDECSWQAVSVYRCLGTATATATATVLAPSLR